MPGKRPVGGGRRGGASGVEGMRGGTNSVGNRRDDGGGSRRDSGSDRRVDEGGSRRDRGADRRVVGGNRSAGRTHGTTGDIGSRRNGAGCGNSSGGGSSNMRSDGRGNRGFDGGASGSHGGSGRSLGGGGASGNVPRGGKSVGGGSGNSRAGGSSRVGGSIGVNGSNVGGERRGQMYERHLTDEIYDASSEDSDYDDEYHDEGFDDDEFDEDLGGNNDKGDVGSEDESDEGSEDEGDGGSEDEGEAQDMEGGDEGSEDDEGETAQHNRRGYSLGLFGQPPPQPHLIRMVGRVIDSPVACRTLLAIMRVHWPAGCIGAKDVDRRFPRWWSRIRKMFFAYYDFDPKHGTKNDAREALNTHMRRNMRKTLCNERKRILKIIKERGGLSLSTGHDAAKEAREHQKIPHTSGAISFQRRAWDIRDKTGNEPKLYDLFLRWHTKDKENKEFTSQAVRIIVEQYLAKCKEQNVDPSEAPIDTWVEVVGVRKNAIIGLPRTSAYEVIPLPPTSGKKRRRRSVDDESGASTGRSVIQHIADDLVMQAVDRTVAFARAHPHEFDLAPEQVNMLAQSVAEGASDLPSDHPLTMATMRELVQVMVSVLGDVYGSNRPTSNCKKGKSIARQDEHRSDDDDGGQSPRPGRSRSGDRNGIWIRGD
ncbi:hypothetical protein POM88_023511 [Heracleum sosnowskyi]|uniref:Uncharacterized protein n=1 Tax=Heracleum sosnowskyi TaxID=360622 RepID=A0AAD8IHU3_9APIA|nr:hypothetical protein POM88_023511 [Heracleum sosnowskyi]